VPKTLPHFIGEQEVAMPVEGLFVMLLVGLVAGWLAGTFVSGGAFGLIGNVVVGVVGAFIGGWLLPASGDIGMGTGLVAAIVSATIGAVVLLALLRFLRRA
jgi:uncharacterized membrane protein YeaQ/YmgE (transglycosylase-associated protein family)